ncbi:MAG: endonuclease MutS2 [Bacteroidota bacterium]
MKVFPNTSLLSGEYRQVIDAIYAHCLSGMGKELAEACAPISDLETIQLLLSRTAQMQEIVSSGLPFPCTVYPDIAKPVGLLRIEGSTLAEGQFMEIALFLEVMRDMHSFFRNRKGVHPELEAILETAAYEPTMLERIIEVLDEHGKVRTSASPELARIRRSLQRTRIEADRLYGSILSKYRKQGYLTEAEESSRNGRRVIAIMAEQKRVLPGIIHDTSATGKTAFLEPEEAVGVNNNIATLEYEEQKEIRRILRQLTDATRRFGPILLIYREQLGLMDFNRAKAIFSISINGSVPTIAAQPFLKLKSARHPLLFLQNKKLKKDTIPFDLELNEDNRILVISGPNAGGKTVCMKTSGILQMMLQSGIPISAHESSEMGVFQNLFVDIGDSQSIEYELSTYSSRLRHMREFLEHVDGNSFFLIDEFGTGTDPNLGGALAEAVLEELNARHARGIITTHYLNLKVMADKTPGIMNGSMEFDLKRLQPLYRLMVGKPGSSYTFLVAERSGLPKPVILNARRKVSGKSLRLEKLLTELENDRELLNARLDAAAKKDRSLSELTANYERLKSDLERNFKVREEKVRKSEERTTREYEERFRAFLKEWKKAKDKKPVIDKYSKVFLKPKRQENPKEAEKRRKEKLDNLRKTLAPGMRVRLENGSTIGVLEQMENDRAWVIFGQFRTICDLATLEVVEDKKTENPKSKKQQP